MVSVVAEFATPTLPHVGQKKLEHSLLIQLISPGRTLELVDPDIQGKVFIISAGNGMQSLKPGNVVPELDLLRLFNFDCRWD